MHRAPTTATTTSRLRCKKTSTSPITSVSRSVDRATPFPPRTTVISTPRSLVDSMLRSERRTPRSLLRMSKALTGHSSANYSVQRDSGASRTNSSQTILSNSESTSLEKTKRLTINYHKVKSPPALYTYFPNKIP